MCRKITSALMVMLLCNSLAIFAQSKAETKFKQQIFTWGTTQNIKLRLRSGEKLEGRITEVKSASFELQVVNATGQINSREIRYNDLDKLSKRRDPDQDVSLRTKLIIAAVTTVLTVVTAATNNE